MLPKEPAPYGHRSRNKVDLKRLNAAGPKFVAPAEYQENGRPIKLTAQMLTKIEMACKTLNSLREIAALIGVDEATLFRWRQRYSKLREQMDVWTAEGRLLPVQQLFKAIMKDERWAIEFALRHRHPDYVRKLELSDFLEGMQASNDDDSSPFDYI